MAIIGTPIANGDGSFVFQTDTGEPLVLRGDSAQRAFNASQAAAPTPTAPTMPANDAMEQAYAPVDNRTANAGGAPPPFDPSVIAGFNRQDKQKAAADVQASTQQVTDPAAYGAAHSHGGSADESHSNMVRTMMDKPLPTPAGTEPAQKGGAVFYKPPQSPGAAPSGGGGGPAKSYPVSQTLQGTMPMTEGEALLTRDAYANRYKAAEATTGVAAKRAEEEAVVRAGVVDANQKAEVAMQAHEQERQRVIGDKLAQVDKLAQEAAAGKIQDYWADKPAEAKFALAILQGVSAWAEGMGGGKAYAIQNVNDAIAQDYKVQAANLENKHRALAAQTNILGHLREEFGDREAAEHAFHAMKLATAGAQLEEINARNLPAEQKAKLAEFAAGLNAEYVDRMQASGRISYSRSEKFGGLGGGEPAFKEADVKHLDTELRKEKVPESYNALDNLEKHIDTSRDDDLAGLGMIKQHVPDALVSSEGLENRRALDRAVLSYAHATGRVTPAEVDLVKKAAIGNGNKASIRAWIRSARNELSNVDRSVRASVPEAAQGEYIRRGGLPQRSNRGPTPVRRAGEE